MNQWFQFVDKDDRTKVDCNLSLRIAEAIQTGDIRYGERILNGNELIIISQWYDKVPELLRDPNDVRTFDRIEQFITELAS